MCSTRHKKQESNKMELKIWYKRGSGPNLQAVHLDRNKTEKNMWSSDESLKQQSKQLNTANSLLI